LLVVATQNMTIRQGIAATVEMLRREAVVVAA
jgi:hypothetical protein